MGPAAAEGDDAAVLPDERVRHQHAHLERRPRAAGLVAGQQPVAEERGGLRVLHVGDPRHQVGSAQEQPAGGPRFNDGSGRHEGIQESATGGVEVEPPRAVDPELALSALSEGENPLTGRERDVLRASLDGASIADIALRLYLSEGTVRNHISTAIQKLNAHNRTEAAQIAKEKGWL